MYISSMPRKYSHDYTHVDTLPHGAMTVSEYAAKRDCTIPYIYKLYRKHIEEGKAIDFNIVVFQKINFVIPN